MEGLVVINAFILAYLIIHGLYSITKSKIVTFILTVIILPLPFLYFLIGGLYGVGTANGYYPFPDNLWLPIFFSPTLYLTIRIIKPIIKEWF